MFVFFRLLYAMFSGPEEEQPDDDESGPEFDEVEEWPTFI